MSGTVAALGSAFGFAFAAPAAHAALVVHGGPSYSAGVGYLGQSQPLGQGPMVASGLGLGQATSVGAGPSQAFGIRFNAADGFDALTGAAGGGSTAYSMNASGLVVGAVDVDALGTIVAAKWNLGSAIASPLTTAIASGPNASSMALSVNDLGRAVGRFNRTDVDGNVIETLPVRWNSGGVATQLGVPTHDALGHADATAYYVNASGTMAGTATTYSTTFTNVGHRALRWNAVGTDAITLNALPADATGSAESYASGINDSGVVIGASSKYDATGEGYLGTRPVRWGANTEAPTELGVLSLDPTGSANGTPNAINSLGTIVGSSDQYDSSGDYAGARAVRWEANSITAAPLGELGGQTLNSEAYGINSDGTAVGYIDFSNGTDDSKHAVVWNDNGAALDLNSLLAANAGWTLTSANSINDAGWISGIGSFDPDGIGGEAAYDRLFLIQLPEPTFGTAMLCATMGMMLRRRGSRN